MNGVIHTLSGILIRSGFGVDFQNDGSFNSATEIFCKDIPTGSVVSGSSFGDSTPTKCSKLTGSSWVDHVYSPFESIYYFWEQGSFTDYKHARVGLAIEMAIVGGFANLSAIEKEMASEWFVVAKSDRDSVHQIAIQERNGMKWHKRSVKSRKKRYAAAVSVIYNMLTTSDAENVIDDIQNGDNLKDNYIDFGREGTIEGDPEGLFDYLEGRAGTTYAVSGAKPGLAHKAFTPAESGVSMSDIVTTVIGILQNGDEL